MESRAYPMSCPSNSFFAAVERDIPYVNSKRMATSFR